MHTPFRALLVATLAMIALPAGAAGQAAKAAAPAAKPAPDAPFVTINGVTIPNLQAEIVRQDMLRSGRRARNEEVIEALVSSELMVQDALKRGLDKSAYIQAYMELRRKEVLQKLFLDDFVKRHPIAEEQVRKEYEEIKARTGATEYHARHILVEDEALAREIAAKLKAPGADFEALAREHSKDSSAQEGGDLGWVTPDGLVPEFATAMVALSKGGLTAAPVKSQFGWHLIKLEDSRAVDFPDYEEVKDRISNQMMQRAAREHVNEMRRAAKIEISAN